MSVKTVAEPGAPYHTTAEVAARLGLSEETIRRLCRRGVIRSVRLGRKHGISPAELARIERHGIHQSSTGPRVFGPSQAADEMYERMLSLLGQMLALYDGVRLAPVQSFASYWREVRDTIRAASVVSELVHSAEHLTERLGDQPAGTIALPIADPTSIIIGGATYGPRDLTPTGQPAAELLTTWALQFIAPLPAEVRELLLRGDYLAAVRAAPHALLQIGAACETYNPVTRRWEAGWHLVGFEGEHLRVQQDGLAIGYYVRWREYVRPPTPSWAPIDEEVPDAA